MLLHFGFYIHTNISHLGFQILYIYMYTHITHIHRDTPYVTSDITKQKSAKSFNHKTITCIFQCNHYQKH